MNWISFEEDSPLMGEWVLCIDEYNPQYYCLGRFTDVDTFSCSSMFMLPVDHEVTHWLRIPEMAVSHDMD